MGGGFFVRFTVLPCFLAWDAFGEKNGTQNLAELVARVEHYRHAPQTPAAPIGCNVLTEPFFLDKDAWIPIPANWSANIQRGLTYDTAEPHGDALWQAVTERLAARSAEIAEPRFGEAYLAHARLGQGVFRTLVTDAYHRRCAVTGERSLPALEAAHIRAHADDGPNRTRNGLLLRADIHRLFDGGYVTVGADLRFVVSRKLREDFENGRDYYALGGQALTNLPERLTDRPAPEFIDWHNRERFLG